MAAITKQEALQRYEEAQELLAGQDLSKLPLSAQLRLLQAQRQIYQEIQLMEAEAIEARDKEYIPMSASLRESEADFQEIRDWAEKAAQSGEAVEGLAKGLGIILSLL
ncbi:hypothetical protein GUA87_05425 [Sneathiella sp. P13V-1]|uniref:hypothetical protein n=1 Tax=Sneathiella sp. P13V-1 TaxID=2697366 RepID=UPI00187B8D03|nr:hypothetical protein [Sneathiella sp. P13V-1]MBE7636275.1 hypothetical protein [Sneathiella sp. P13V-1]